MYLIQHIQFCPRVEKYIKYRLDGVLDIRVQWTLLVLHRGPDLDHFLLEETDKYYKIYQTTYI